MDGATGAPLSVLDRSDSGAGCSYDAGWARRGTFRLGSAGLRGELWCSDVGSGSPVLVVHGAGSHGPMWAADLESLTTSYRLIVPTRRGYPGSPPSPRDWNAHSRDMVAVLDARSVGSAAVVAHSGGCIVALDLAVRYPERVERVVLLDPVVRLRSFLTPALVRAFLSTRFLRRVRGEHRALEAWMRYALSYRTGDSAWTRMPEARRESLRANAAGVFADQASGDGSDQIDDKRLAALALPVAVVLAGLSPNSFARSGEHLARTIPGAQRVVIEDSGHALAFDQPDQLLSALQSALEQYGQNSRTPHPDSYG
jgi:pimeloyl-ACP methyl ester carboxylesterase